MELQGLSCTDKPQFPGTAAPPPSSPPPGALLQCSRKGSPPSGVLGTHPELAETLHVTLPVTAPLALAASYVTWQSQTQSWLKSHAGSRDLETKQ